MDLFHLPQKSRQENQSLRRMMTERQAAYERDPANRDALLRDIERATRRCREEVDKGLATRDHRRVDRHRAMIDELQEKARRLASQ